MAHDKYDTNKHGVDLTQQSCSHEALSKKKARVEVLNPLQSKIDKDEKTESNALTTEDAQTLPISVGNLKNYWTLWEDDVEKAFPILAELNAFNLDKKFLSFNPSLVDCVRRISSHFLSSSFFSAIGLVIMIECRTDKPAVSRSLYFLLFALAVAVHHMCYASEPALTHMVNRVAFQLTVVKHILALWYNSLAISTTVVQHFFRTLTWNSISSTRKRWKYVIKSSKDNDTVKKQYASEL
uniref:Uncharacterized protein n=1 Tax=Glossina brevipalpis TaxID=37001 RepID=A0A1A9X0V0_9MUSC